MRRPADDQLARPPQHYVHGLDNGCVIVPLRVAAWLNTRAGLTELRAANRGVDAEVDNVLVAIATAAAIWADAVAGTTPGKREEPAPPSQWMTTGDVADRLNMTVRGVRVAIETGRLQAERQHGRWFVTREEFEHFRTVRQQRTS